jgi:hypothetical protein
LLQAFLDLSGEIVTVPLSNAAHDVSTELTFRSGIVKVALDSDNAAIELMKDLQENPEIPCGSVGLVNDDPICLICSHGVDC